MCWARRFGISVGDDYSVGGRTQPLADEQRKNGRQWWNDSTELVFQRCDGLFGVGWLEWVVADDRFANECRADTKHHI
jgi:hypothetical protein